MFQVRTIAPFDKALKQLSKKYPSIKEDYIALLTELEKADQPPGTPLGKDCFKLRVAISSKNKGKSGGARVIFFACMINNDIILLTIYDKSDHDSINDGELLELLKYVE